MPQRDINEIRTEKIAVRCDTEGEFKQILELLNCDEYRISEMIDGYSNERHNTIFIGGTGDTLFLIINNHGHTIHPASDYLTATPAKYSAEEIKLMDKIMLEYIFKLGEDSSRAYELAETLILNRRKIIGQ